MRNTELQRAALIGVVALVILGAAGFFGFQMIGGQEEAALPTKIPSRNDCINDGLRNVQGSSFSRQTAYDIEVRCEQLIQSLEARAGKAPAK